MRILSRTETENRTRQKKSKLYKSITEGTFPKPVKIGAASGWIESEVNAWIQARIRERDNVEAA